MYRARLLLSVLALAAFATPAAAQPKGKAKGHAKAKKGKGPVCDPDNGGLTLPEGFCALVVGSDLGHVRHLAVAANGDIFAAVSKRGGNGGLLVLRDTDGDGKADENKRHGDTGGNGILLTDDAVYFAPDDRVLRFPWKAGSLEPAGPAETIVKDLPTGGHSSKTLAPAPGGGLYVAIGSRSNSCQEADRKPKSPGQKPCAELSTRAGIWRFDAKKTDQTVADGKRYATGLRNATALGIEPGGQLYMCTHGRDQLGENWGFSKEDNAENPSEEFGPVKEGDDYGWPFCYHDPRNKLKVQAPEYGGDGKVAGECAKRTQPAVAFPAHWAPIALTFYTKTQFPAEYRGGAFLSFHGSWNRAPLPQAGFRVVYVPFKDGKPSGEWKDFVLPAKSPTAIRPTGVAVGPDGSLYVGADADGKIWRVMWNPKGK